VVNTDYTETFTTSAHLAYVTPIPQTEDQAFDIIMSQQLHQNLSQVVLQKCDEPGNDLDCQLAVDEILTRDEFRLKKGTLQLLEEAGLLEEDVVMAEPQIFAEMFNPQNWEGHVGANAPYVIRIGKKKIPLIRKLRPEKENEPRCQHDFNEKHWVSGKT
jgi:hypothetical protein